jgi:hypothetical protein
MEKENLINDEIETLEEQISTHSKLLSQWKDELKVETERTIAIMRNIVREEQKIDSLTIRMKELQDKIRGENVLEKEN